VDSSGWLPTALSAFAALLAIAAQAEPPSTQRGLQFATANCARCHSIGSTGVSPMAAAPPFRNLHLRYPVDDLAEALAEGIMTAHPAMPQFKLGVTEIDDLIAYLKSLE
jgi:mono/diheme cytochrome c family protein